MYSLNENEKGLQKIIGQKEQIDELKKVIWNQENIERGTSDYYLSILDSYLKVIYISVQINAQIDTKTNNIATVLFEKQPK